jgi:uncharacterized protein YukE
MATDSRFDSAVEFVKTVYQALKAAWDGIVNGVNWVLDNLAFLGIGPAVKAAFDELVAPVTEALDRIVFYCNNPGDPGGIRTVGEDWTNNVGAHASTQAGQLAKGQLDSDNSWSGQAAERYGEAAILQSQALTQIKTMTDALQNTLNEIAAAITNFWIGFANYLGVYLVAMAACAIAAASGAGILVSLGTAAAATATFLVGMTTLATDLDNTLADKKSRLDQQTTVGAPFTNNSWPSAVSEKFSDASVTDGDTSDWIPR